jgi:hypothetical protein
VIFLSLFPIQNRTSRPILSLKTSGLPDCNNQETFIYVYFSCCFQSRNLFINILCRIISFTAGETSLDNLRASSMTRLLTDEEHRWYLMQMEIHAFDASPDFLTSCLAVSVVTPVIWSVVAFCLITQTHTHTHKIVTSKLMNLFPIIH